MFIKHNISKGVKIIGKSLGWSSITRILDLRMIYICVLFISHLRTRHIPDGMT